MSQRALRLGTRDHLRTTFAWNSKECDCTGSRGMPPAAAGERFIAVHSGDWSNQQKELLDEYFGVLVTVTVRLPRVPADRISQEVIDKAGVGLEALLEQIRAVVHSSYTLMGLANGHIAGAGTTVSGFVEPPIFLNGGTPEDKGPEWFQSESNQVIAGLAQTLTFGMARRCQSLNDTMS